MSLIYIRGQTGHTISSRLEKRQALISEYRGRPDPLMKLFYSLDVQNPLYYIPFYTPSAVVGGAMGVAVLLMFKKSGVLERMLNEMK